MEASAVPAVSAVSVPVKLAWARASDDVGAAKVGKYLAEKFGREVLDGVRHVFVVAMMGRHGSPRSARAAAAWSITSGKR